MREKEKQSEWAKGGRKGATDLIRNTKYHTNDCQDFSVEQIKNERKHLFKLLLHMQRTFNSLIIQ